MLAALCTLFMLDTVLAAIGRTRLAAALAIIVLIQALVLAALIAADIDPMTL
ncbi:MAG: hypothetical protein AAF078_04135 [Planctomycetota bacterium]